MLITVFNASGWDSSRYANHSSLSSGTWVKVSVPSTGIYFLSFADLKRLGFNDASKVGVYGYGGRRLPDVLNEYTYIDDIPRVAVLRGDEGIYFFAVGPEKRLSDADGHITLSFNPYSNYGYYFLTQNNDPDLQMKETGDGVVLNGTPTNVFTEVTFHEIDQWSPGETGHFMVGEELRYTPRRSFRFMTPGAAKGKAEAGASVFTNLIGGAVWTLEVGRTTKMVAVPATPLSEFLHGNVSQGWTDSFDVEEGVESIDVSITLGGGSGNVRGANLDWMALNYQRKIKLDMSTPWLVFTTPSQSISVGGATVATEVWDVTDLTDIRRMRVSQPDESGNIFFSTPLGGERTYVAFTPGTTAKFPSPGYVEDVSNQDLHSVSGVEMVIITSSTFLSAAKKLASHRMSRGVNTIVVVQEEVFNEFSSGSADVNAFRKFLKMLYDRGKDEMKLKYVLLFGRSSFDNRGLTTGRHTYERLPQWQTDEGVNDNTSFTTDDVLGFLDDGSGTDLASDTLSVALGRLPVTSLAEANAVVDKIISYESYEVGGGWNNRVVFIADDEDNGIHMTQTENQISMMKTTAAGVNILVEKIYIDAYPLENSVAQGARDEFYRILDEGAIWVNYIGHANATSLSAEGILNYSDVSALFLKHIPFIYAATCDFMRWDSSVISGAERLFLTKDGGVIGAISATRPVYISQNGNLSASLGKQMMAMGADNNPLTIGEILMKAKNGYSVNGDRRADENKLRYGLLGDPAMRLRIAPCEVKVQKINDTEMGGEEPPVLEARQELTVEGIVTENGNVCDDYNGEISLTLYDADESVTTTGRGDGAMFTFDRHGTRLFMGTDSVRNGRFNIKVIMPSEVAYNYRCGTMSLYSKEQKDGGRIGSGIERRFYVYGTDDDVVADTVAPVIDSLYVNHPSFVNGETVNATPVIIAHISDDRAINLSQAGVGHSMTISVDNGAQVYSDVSNYYQPEGVDKGKIFYRLQGLADGYHELTLRVWDTAGNSASRTIKFYVSSTLSPVIYDIFTDSNPATASANFYISHDRPDGNLRVTLAIYDLSGRPVWINTVTGRSDRFARFPITWNLTNMNGSRVQRGIYLYRASVAEYNGSGGSGTEVLTPTKKIAVTAR